MRGSTGCCGPQERHDPRDGDLPEGHLSRLTGAAAGCSLPSRPSARPPATFRADRFCRGRFSMGSRRQEPGWLESPVALR
jgi:hypothetical protein